jgi:CBS domain-containing protein
MNIASILKEKSRDVVYVAPTMRVTEITGVLARHDIGAVLVLDSMLQVMGIVSERDIARCLAARGEATLGMTAAQIMTSDVVMATPATTIEEALEMMSQGRFRHLPVVDGHELCGLVSIGDVVKWRISQQALEVDSLRAYVQRAD